MTMSSGNIRERDISHNRIDMAARDDRAALQAILESFRGCYMTKLNLGRNNLGSAGLEILARVHMQSEVDSVGKMHEDDSAEAYGKMPSNHYEDRDGKRRMLHPTEEKVKASRVKLT